MDTRETAEWIFDRLNAHDVEALRELWTADTVDFFPHGMIRGADNLAEFFGSMVAAMPDINWDVRSIVTSDDTACIHWRITGTFNGAPFMGFNPTGSKIALDGMDKFRFVDGRIETVHVVYDQLSFARQIGAIPDDGTAADRLLKALFNLGTRLRGLQTRPSRSTPAKRPQG